MPRWARPAGPGKPPPGDDEPTPWEGVPPKPIPDGPCRVCGGTHHHDVLCRIDMELQAAAVSDPHRIARYRHDLPGYDPVRCLREEAAEWEAAGRPAMAQRCRAVAAMVDEIIFLAGPTTTPMPRATGETAPQYFARFRAAPPEKPAPPPAPKKKPGAATWDDLFQGGS